MIEVDRHMVVDHMLEVHHRQETVDSHNIAGPSEVLHMGSCVRISSLEKNEDITCTDRSFSRFFSLTFSHLTIELQKFTERIKGLLCIAQLGADRIKAVTTLGGTLTSSFVENGPSLRRKTQMSFRFF